MLASELGCTLFTALGNGVTQDVLLDVNAHSVQIASV